MKLAETIGQSCVAAGEFSYAKDMFKRAESVPGDAAKTVLIFSRAQLV